VARNLGDDVRRSPEAVDADGFRIPGKAIRAVADQPGAQQRRRLGVAVAVRERKAKALVRNRVLGVTAVQVVTGEARLLAEILASGAAEFACAAGRAACSRIARISMPVVVVLQDRVARALEVVELAALERAPEHPADQEYERDGERYEEVEAFHVLASSVPPPTRMAFRTTMKELAAMPTAASQGPIQPAAASGSASAL